MSLPVDRLRVNDYNTTTLANKTKDIPPLPQVFAKIIYPSQHNLSNEPLLQVNSNKTEKVISQ